VPCLIARKILTAITIPVTLALVSITGKPLNSDKKPCTNLPGSSTLASSDYITFHHIKGLVIQVSPRKVSLPDEIKSIVDVPSP